MARRNRDTRAILRTIERSEQRSRLFWWMVDHHDEIVEAARRHRVNWGGFCAEAAKLGLTDTRGRAPTARNARETWRQARRAVAALRAAEAAKPPARPGSIYPSRIPKDWKPEPFRTLGSVGSGTGAALRPPASAAPGAPATPPAHRRPRFLGSPDDPPEVQEMWANLEDQFDKEDRWAGGLPVKRRR